MKEYRDEIVEICHEIVKDGYRLGLVTDDEIKEFEEDSFVSETETTPATSNYAAEKPLKTGYTSVAN